MKLSEFFSTSRILRSAVIVALLGGGLTAFASVSLGNDLPTTIGMSLGILVAFFVASTLSAVFLGMIFRLAERFLR